jgi:ParB family chromosome partitioning protein
MSKQKASKGLGRGLTDMPHYQNHFSSDSKQKHPLFRSVDNKVNEISSGSNSPRIIGKMAGDIALLPIGQIMPNKDQPRTEFDKSALKKLAASIVELGIIQPITVRKLSALKYQIISGERRFRASQLAGLEELPAYIREADDVKLLEMALVENVQREDLHPIEIATSFQRLIKECSLSHEELGNLVGKSRSSITNQLRLLDLPEEIKIALVTKDISQGHAKALLSMADNPEQQMILFSLIKDENLSVRLAEEMSRKASKKKRKKLKIEMSDDEVIAIDSINLRFSQRVKLVKASTSSGKIEIKYSSQEELDRFLDKLSN